MNCRTLSQCWAHQNHQNRVILPLCTSHQHTQSQFVGEHVVSQGLLLSFEGTWSSLTLSAKRRKGNTSKLSMKTNMGRHSFFHYVSHYISNSNRSRTTPLAKRNKISIIATKQIQYLVHHVIRIVHKERAEEVSWLRHPKHGHF